VKSPASSTINQGRCHHSMHGHFIPPPHCAPDHFFLSVKPPSLTAAYAPAKKPMKLEPIVMIHGGSISDTTPMSMSRACSTAPPNVPPSQKTIQTTRMSEFVRRDVVTNLGRPPENESEIEANSINSVLQRATTTSVQEIDKLITELQRP